VVEDPALGVWLHEIEAQAAAGRWQNICRADREHHRLALFIEGHDTPDGRQVRVPGQVSITCTAGVQGKCLRAGYRRRLGELVTKDELLDAVWDRRFISEGVIKSAVSELRQALQGNALLPAWIETVPRRGDRFTGSASRASSKMRRRVPTFG